MRFRRWSTVWWRLSAGRGSRCPRFSASTRIPARQSSRRRASSWWLWYSSWMHTAMRTWIWKSGAISWNASRQEEENSKNKKREVSWRGFSFSFQVICLLAVLSRDCSFLCGCSYCLGCHLDTCGDEAGRSCRFDCGSHWRRHQRMRSGRLQRGPRKGLLLRWVSSYTSPLSNHMIQKIFQPNKRKFSIMAKIETGIFYYKVAGRDCQRRKTVRNRREMILRSSFLSKISENKALEMEIILN